MPRSYCIGQKYVILAREYSDGRIVNEDKFYQSDEMANIAKMSPSELEDLEKLEIYIHDQRNAIEKAENKAKKEGR